MKLPALYELAEEFRTESLALADLDLPEEVITDTLEGLRYPLEQKAANVAAVARNIEAIAEKIAEAERAMAARRRSLEKRAERLRSYIKACMEHAAIKKIESPWFALAIQFNPPSVEIVDASMVPDAYKRIPPIPEPEPDKQAIKAALQEGKEVPGARITQTTRLVIK